MASRSRNNSAKTWGLGPTLMATSAPVLAVLEGALLSGSEECRSGRDAKQSTIFGCPFGTEDGPHFNSGMNDEGGARALRMHIA